MKPFTVPPLRRLCLWLALAALPSCALAEDIDIFTGASAGSAINPRILIVLDNTANWSRQSQQWPGGVQQGQSEANAIKTVVSTLNSTVNLGLMEFVTGGTANQNGGYIRFAVKPMTAANQTAFSSALTTIYNNITTPNEKRNANTPYGNLMYDAYNYFAGANDYSPTAIVTSLADAAGYAVPYTRFAAPLTADDTCGRSFIIFIGNPDARGPTADDAANTAALTALGGVSKQLGLPNFTTSSTSQSANLGNTLQCYSSANAAQAGLADYATQCASYTQGCSIGAATSGTPACSRNTSLYSVIGTNTTITNTPTGTSTLDNNPFNADEWARFMHDKGVPVAGTTIRPYVTTYTIDVYNQQPNATHTSLLMSMAKAGGGKYFNATNEQAIVAALKQILVEIQAVNSTFASTSLPVNATNRSQNENQVFIGMFRPDADAKPRWFGNLKRYQLVANGAGIDLGDATGTLAVNPLTGFITPCAASYWTSDSGSYWSGLGLNPDPASGCSTSAQDPYSDLPDGPQVEKGAVAEVLRKGNQPPGTNTTPTWAVNRNMYTASGTSLTSFSTASSGLSDQLVRFIRGEDVNNEKGTGATSTTRPSIHGDVIHSRPLPVNYGGSGVTVFYGANDGTFRAVDAGTGAERWSFVAPEFFSRLGRLMSNSPLVAYPNLAAGIVPTPQKKDYFFDGSTGVYQNQDSSRVWVLPTMRRGGRMIYALDVSNPATPVLKWKAGCPDLADDNNCTNGMSQIGQTWSTPSVAFIRGYSTTQPVVVVGGGYDGCEDADTTTPACGSTKGGMVYILDGNTGAVIASFATTRAVASDIAMVDIDNDGMPDYAYAADTGGNIYRIDFVANPASVAPLKSGNWSLHRVAYTNGAGRKFLFAPALLAVSGKVYVAIGSGDREHPLQSQYPYSSVTNRFYVYKDDLSSNASTPARNLDTDLIDYTTNTTCDTTSVLPNSNLNGWYMNLNQFGQGEQVVTSALIASGMVTFSTNRPVPAVAGTCATPLGKAEGYWVNLFNGSGGIDTAGTCNGARASEFVGGGLPPSPVMATGVPVNGRPVSVVIGAVQRDGSTSAAISPQKVRPAIASKRRRVYSTVSGQ
ncbi:hypothetical protein H3H36_12060 [Duganella sp. FT3S]|uniref:PilY1 beta-propeller domain-containing protein n=1 Tax=Rugamonas fusca TaxID=2758568 RepID=A0A7W2I721_9BURK|nr:PilC/PilY family type IV pilus protein [Rugamonas fusca]MBA5606092.1 hypothetical protein [Rugamonas fusca]